MIYLLSKFHCAISGKTTKEILPCVFYELTNIKNEVVIVSGFNNEIPFAINFFELVNLENKVENVEKVIINSNTFLILNKMSCSSPHFTHFKVGQRLYCLSVANDMVLTIDGEKVLEKQLYANVKYSHFEQIGEFCLIYLEGKRKFIIITRNTELQFADYYDEINSEKENRYFMRRLYDSLNHGKVAKLKDKKFESYLVYLDDNELKLQTEFVFLVFLDCFVAGNFKYCNELLHEDIKQKDAKNISKFFNDFDEYIPFKNIALTFKKNTLAGIYEFVVKNNKIENIIHLMQPC